MSGCGLSSSSWTSGTHNVKESTRHGEALQYEEKPGTLGTGGAYVDVVAYLLRANRFPSGHGNCRARPRVKTTIERKMMSSHRIGILAVTAAVSIGAAVVCPVNRRMARRRSGTACSPRRGRRGANRPSSARAAAATTTSSPGIGTRAGLERHRVWSGDDNLASLFMKIRDADAAGQPSQLGQR